jgi:hypothetical protein
MSFSINRLASGVLMALKSKESMIVAGNFIGMVSITSAILGAQLSRQGETVSKGTEAIRQAFDMAWNDATPAHELVLGWLIDASRAASLEAVKFGYQNPELPWNLIADGWAVVMMLSVTYITVRAGNMLVQAVKS